jgi:hypothetical protein
MREDFDFDRHDFRKGNPRPIVVGSIVRAFQSLIATIAIIGITVWFLTLAGVIGPSGPKGPKPTVSPQKEKSPEKKPSPAPFFNDEKYNRHWEVL